MISTVFFVRFRDDVPTGDGAAIHAILDARGR